jgi:chromosome segregation ATPase
MEVISGMAPRPSTPQPYATRPASAPNSPARNAFANFPTINRLPSQDSLDRSIHNESGHGKTTAQIVRDLKGANAAMGAKTASMEAQFMNQLHEVSKKNQEKQRQMEEQLRQLNKQLAHLEAYKAASDSKLQEKDAALSKTKEESAFQRHTISDLKNQLYQLQSEMEEQEMDKRDDLEQLLQDNQEMARQMAQLQAQLQEYETHTGENGDKNPQDEYYRRQWQETKGELDHHRQRLTVTETNLGSLQQVKETLVDEHSQYVKQLQGELLSKSEHWKRRERDLQSPRPAPKSDKMRKIKNNIGGTKRKICEYCTMRKKKRLPSFARIWTIRRGNWNCEMKSWKKRIGN